DFPIRWIFHPDNRGLAAARNTGAQAASGSHLLFLDDDVLPGRDLLQQHTAAQSQSPEWPPTIVCGRIIEDRQEPFHSKTDEYMQQSWLRDLEQALPCKTQSINTVGSDAERSAWFGLNCSIRRELFDQVGGFDTYMRSDEELELGFRLYRCGVQTQYAPLAIVRHRGSKDMSGYFPRCWNLSGSLDVHRAIENNERSAGIEQLADLTNGTPSQRFWTNLAWNNSQGLLTLAGIAQKITDVTGSRTAFSAWARLGHLGEYWAAVRSTGTARTQLADIAGPVRRILMFHSISQPQNVNERSYYTSPRRFRQFLSWLELMNYTSASAAAWLEGTLPARSVLLTFDDAYDDLFPELLHSARKLKPLVFVVASQIGKTNAWDQKQGLRTRRLLTLDQMREMQRHGVTFGSHSLTHPLLTTLSTCTLRREVIDSKRILEDLLGTAVDWFAYPYGDVDRRVRAAVLEAGYKAAATTNAGFNRWQDPLALNRFEVSDCDWLLDFALKIATGRDYRKSLLARLKLSNSSAAS
ncbi:MAG TPA: polysaccharide deacetylase family protein, partial [Terriglobales bacterium]